MTTARLAAILHVTTLVISAGVGALVVSPHPAWFVGAVVVLTGWTVAFCSVALRVGLVRLLVAGDVLVTCVICLIIGRLVAADAMDVGGVWLAPMTACTLLTVAFGLPSIAAVLVGVVIAGCTIAGMVPTDHLAVGIGLAMNCLIQIATMATVMALLRRSSRTADQVFSAEQRQRRLARIDEVRRADECAQLRTIHATALATLTMIGAGAVSGSSSAVRGWAGADAAALRSMPDGGGVPVQMRLDERLAEVIANHRGRLRIVFDPVPCWAAPEVVEALSEAVVEALANTARHSGADQVAVAVRESGEALTVQVTDNGRGFEAGRVPGHRYGVRGSIVGGVEAVGGAACVDSTPGAGCRWTLSWPATPMSPVSASRIAEHLERGAARAAFALAGLWHLINDVMGVVLNWHGYRHPYGGWISAGLWLVFTIIGVLAALRWWGRSAPGRSFVPAAAAVLLAGVVVNVVICAGPDVDTRSLAFTNADWAIGVSGWIGILVFWRCRTRWLVALFVANPLVQFATLVTVATLNNLDYAQWISATYGITMLQVVFVLGVRFLRHHGDRAALSAQRQDQTRTDQQAANAVHEDRRRRYEQVGDASGRLLEDVATGRVDHADAATRHRAAVEASRLRRLIAERDDVTDRLTHELRAGADVAERRGVEVEMVTFGTVPRLSVGVRRALTDGPARLLATARSRARVTVAATPDEVSIGVVVDGVLAEQELATLTAVQIGEDGEGLWLETIWRK